MAVVIETTLGDITVDLYLDQRPVTCLNFLKLCKMKYYNYNLFHTIRSGFIAQTGDPTGEGSGGDSIWGVLEGSSKRFFSGEKMPKIRHTDAGLLSMVCTDDMMVGSQFFFTLAPNLDSLDGVHCVIGEVVEGLDILAKLNGVICDETHRPYQDVRITHTVVLEDPFNDPSGLRAPSRSPSPNPERLKGGRLAPDEELDETQGKSQAEIQELIEEKEAKARATILEIVGDLPDADVAPPENVLFVCKLNPVTTDDDLEIIFSRFGKINSCEVIRDKKTGDSLQYAFIEFDDKKSCEDAYFKMDNVLIDDRRIHVDFSQSVSKMKWLGKGRGVKYFNDDDSTFMESNKPRPNRSPSRERHNRKRHHYRESENKEKLGMERDRSHKNEKNSNSQRRDRSRSRVGCSRNKHSKNNRHVDDQNGSKDSRNNKMPSRSYKDDNLHKEENNRGHEDYEPKRSRKMLSPFRNKRKGHSTSPIRKHKHIRKDENVIIEKASERPTHKCRKSHKKTQLDSKNEKHHKKCSKSFKHFKKSVQQDSDLDEPQTPSPIFIQSTTKSFKICKRGKSKLNHNMKKNKKRRKPSTSSSDSDTSDSSTSSSESSSSSESDNRKRKLKRRKRRYPSSTSSSSTTSSSSSSYSSSDSSTSSSDSEPFRKRHKKTYRKKTSKKLKHKF